MEAGDKMTVGLGSRTRECACLIGRSGLLA